MAESDAPDRPTPPPETYEAIMQATYRAFCKHGYADLTTREIAEEFAKSRSLLHYHYDTKQELIVALLEYLLESHPAKAATDEIADPDERLELFIDRGLFGPENAPFDFWDFHTALLELRLHAHRNDAYREQLDRTIGLITDLLAATIREGIETGCFRDVDPEETAQFLYDAIDAARIRKITLGHDDAPRRTRRAIETFVLPTLRAADDDR
ncbi:MULTISPECIES: TetR/AcrR family transcriptional regulator [Halococcus]|uniref:Transcription regulator n=1 Tax=Halococcus salifodinae DSM 8989 TaxID=1227456 RepID=M0NCH1_9EURY|nr:MULTISPECIES: TetR/AcrR family transcriptional regulator [Halococcus]EMA55273.1 transcription regulator [Halococcus salifodinae DSM 8989]